MSILNICISLPYAYEDSTLCDFPSIFSFTRLTPERARGSAPLKAAAPGALRERQNPERRIKGREFKRDGIDKMVNPQPLYERGDSVSKNQLAEAIATFKAYLDTYQGYCTHDMKRAREVLARKWYRYPSDLKRRARAAHCDASRATNFGADLPV